MAFGRASSYLKSFTPTGRRAAAEEQNTLERPQLGTDRNAVQLYAEDHGEVNTPTDKDEGEFRPTGTFVDALLVTLSLVGWSRLSNNALAYEQGSYTSLVPPGCLRVGVVRARMCRMRELASSCTVGLR